MRPTGKLKYVVLSGVYAAFFGLFGGLFGRMAFDYLQTGVMKNEIDPIGPGNIEGSICWTAIVVGIQVYRVFDSKRRTTETAEPLPVVTTFSSIYYHFQLKIMCILLLLPVCLMGLLLYFPFR